MKKVLLVALLLLGFAGAAGAAEHATPDEAKAMAVKAAEYLKANGSEKAFAAFKAPDGGFRDRDLYVVVQDHNGVMAFHPIAPALIGKSMLDLKDVDGKPFNREVQAIKDTGWVEFKWMDPTTKAVAPKKSYVVNTGDYFVMVGAYVQ
ncbi:MAG TPA: cache domain-containing protein [Stellaceae bacterium]|nr:cache domain-containing protein [Stellaceae bacterium]